VITVASAQANPTCNSGTYSGGLSCCAHGRIMLDTAQERRPELLRYHMKFRFWYQVGCAGARRYAATPPDRLAVQYTMLQPGVT
jgi:hypothetical protein